MDKNCEKLYNYASRELVKLDAFLLDQYKNMLLNNAVKRFKTPKQVEGQKEIDYREVYDAKKARYEKNVEMLIKLMALLTSDKASKYQNTIDTIVARYERQPYPKSLFTEDNQRLIYAILSTEYDLDPTYLGALKARKPEIDKMVAQRMAFEIERVNTIVEKGDSGNIGFAIYNHVANHDKVGIKEEIEEKTLQNLRDNLDIMKYISKLCTSLKAESNGTVDDYINQFQLDLFEGKMLSGDMIEHLKNIEFMYSMYDPMFVPDNTPLLDQKRTAK